MTKPIIAIDIDDVLAATTEALRLIVNKRYGVGLTPEHYNQPGEYHKYYERVWEANGLQGIVSKEELNDQMVLDQSHVQPQERAIEVLRALSARNNLVVVTARNDSWRPATEKWLALHFPGVFRSVHFAGQRHDPQRRTKGDVCAEIGAQWLIDDNMEHAEAALDKGIKVILFGNYGWHTDVTDTVFRCADWDAVAAHFGVSRYA